MTWGEKIDTRLHAKDNAKECMAIVRALAAERDALQGLLRKSQERINALEEESCELESEIKAQAKEYEREIEQIEVDCCECHAKRVAQVAVLRKGMEVIADTTSHKRAVQLAIRFVATTPSEAAERVQRLVTALEEIQKSGTGWDDDGSVVRTYEAMLAASALSEWRRQT